MRIRHQLAAYSPLTPRAIVRAGLAAGGLRRGAREQLRRRLLDLLAADECILVGSGTQALEYAIRRATAGRADAIVALPAFSCYDVASAAIGADVRVALYDIEPRTLAPDLDSLERVLAEGAAVAVLAPLYGIPFDWEGATALSRRYGVPLIEDAAQGHGATWRSTPLGALGSVSTVSFGRGKGWTGGGGGAVLLRGGPSGAGVELKRSGAARNLKVVAGLMAQWALGRPTLYGIPRAIPALALGETIYHSPSTLEEMAESSAAAAATNEAASVEEANVRRRNASLLLSGLVNSCASNIHVRTGGEAGYLRLPLLVPGGMRGLPSHATGLGVAQSYPTTLAVLPQLSNRLVAAGSWPGADQLARDLITFPTHSRIAAKELESLLELVAR